MNRRIALRALSAVVALAVSPAVAQKPAPLQTIGLLMMTLGPTDPLLKGLRDGLRDLGYVDGQNIRFEFRGAYGDVNRLPVLASELARLMVDVIVASPDLAVLAAKRAVGTVPIVMVMFNTDPVAARVIESFSKPGGNVTGLYGRQSEMVAKRLQLLQEMLPGLSRVGVLYDASGARNLPELHAAARALRITLVQLEIREPYDFRDAFDRARDARVCALMTLDTVPLYTRRDEIALLASERRVPTMAQFQQFPKAGGLMSYGTDNEAVFLRTAYFVDRILKGGKPKDIPVEQMASFKLVVNLRAATALGITIPKSILLRADEVVR